MRNYLKKRATLHRKAKSPTSAMESSSSSVQGHGQPSGSSHSGQPNHDNKQREELRCIAQETLTMLPGLLKQLGTGDMAKQVVKYSFEDLTRLHPDLCPSCTRPATIRVINDDALNVAIKLCHEAQENSPQLDIFPPAIVNFVNPLKPGGGWLDGAMAEEEAICFRSSLALSLNKEYYPLEIDEALYSPYVLVVRDDFASGHKISSLPAPNLPVLSVLTISAMPNPQVNTFTRKSGTRTEESRSGNLDKQVFANDRDRDLTKAKMRHCLRMAARHRHDMLVLGALGCGVDGNPPEDVAHCWLEVLRENEFSGNWWKEVCFAVFDPKNTGNFEIFKRVLKGHQV
ncbi:hypothetical protein F53441_13152 [Fusarium austroafricanum]|uniref:Microbial-type PARG catalytic domain-containing protein n=1 Tax=Fusarium austroafricanum TaxID=2364996 RepID=A0A8H4JRE4_9HYPO|nr:hypothetical protein F53441_13152 [Fusarium austroafricanum]